MFKVLSNCSDLLKPLCTVCCRNFSSAKSNYICSIGLEIHAQISTKSKLFSTADYSFGSQVNNNVNLLDAAIPGTLPVLNKKCVEIAVLTALSLSCQVNPVSHFDRKHYFYADLPSGYQITQQRSPIARNGRLDFHVYNPGFHKVPYRKSCQLTQIQLEQDSGKSLHDDDNRRSLIDLNRAGVGLMEFVFEPELSDGEEAAALVKELILILKRLGACSCKMEEGALRVDANISVSKDPSKLGVRTEVKNIGTVRGVANAVKYEYGRQVTVLENGGNVVNETRNWDPQLKKTISMRDKEEKQDYRFMPEPNLPPLIVHIAKDSAPSSGSLDLRHAYDSIPELPEESRLALQEKYNFSSVYVIMLVGQPVLYNYFKEIMKFSEEQDAKIVWNVLVVQLLNVLYKCNLEVEDCTLSSIDLAEVSHLLSTTSIDMETCRYILELKINGSLLSPRDIVKKNNWFLVSDPNRIEAICKELIERNGKAVKQAKKGKKRALQSILNDTVNITSDKINLSLASKRLKELLVDNEDNSK